MPSPFCTVWSLSEVYDILIDAALWNGEWSRAVALLKDVVDLGFPVDLVKHRRLVQDLKEFYGGKDAAIGIAAEVIAADKELPDPTTTGREWLAKVSASSRYADSSGTMVASKAAMVDYMSLQAFAASFSPHWLDGVRSGATTALPELCKEMLLSAESSAPWLEYVEITWNYQVPKYDMCVDVNSKCPIRFLKVFQDFKTKFARITNILFL